MYAYLAVSMLILWICLFLNLINMHTGFIIFGCSEHWWIVYTFRVLLRVYRVCGPTFCQGMVLRTSRSAPSRSRTSRFIRGFPGTPQIHLCKYSDAKAYLVSCVTTNFPELVILLHNLPNMIIATLNPPLKKPSNNNKKKPPMNALMNLLSLWH